MFKEHRDLPRCPTNSPLYVPFEFFGTGHQYSENIWSRRLSNSLNEFYFMKGFQSLRMKLYNLMITSTNIPGTMDLMLLFIFFEVPLTSGSKLIESQTVLMMMMVMMIIHVRMTHLKPRYNPQSWLMSQENWESLSRACIYQFNLKRWRKYYRIKVYTLRILQKGSLLPEPLESLVWLWTCLW